MVDDAQEVSKKGRTPVNAPIKNGVFAGKNVNVASPVGWANGMPSLMD